MPSTSRRLSFGSVAIAKSAPTVFWAPALIAQVDEGWNLIMTREQLLAHFPDLDRPSTSSSSMPMVSSPGDYSPTGCIRSGIMVGCISSGTPRIQGVRQAIEDATALGIIFGRGHSYMTDIRIGLKLYETVRKL